MNRRHFLLVILLVFAVGLSCATTAYSAQRKAIKDVSTDAFTSETQIGIATGDDSFNLTWVIPVEFWDISLSKDKSVTPAQRREITKVLRKYVIVGVVCADISQFGGFKFYDARKVYDNLSVAYINGDGKRIPLKMEMRVEGKAQLIIDAMKPIIQAALGRMGDNFHFFVCENKSDGKAISPYKPGAFEITLGQIGQNGGGTGKVEFPLNCLFVPRECPTCGKEAHISWKYCPWCGTKEKD